MTANKAMVVAIDGPAGAGKSTVARAVSQAVGYTLVDTGAIYRALALVALERKVDLQDGPALASLAEGLDIHFGDAPEHESRIWADGVDVTARIRTSEVSRAVTLVSSHAEVRASLMAMQRALAERGHAVLEGRDIGTVICPGAPVKFFLDASLEERARRRHEELESRGESDTYENVLADMASRDARDSGRKVAPLRAAEDAIRLDCTRMTPAEVVATIVGKVRQVESERPGSGHAQSARVVWAAARAPGPEVMVDEGTQAVQASRIQRFFAAKLPDKLSKQPRLLASLSGTYLFVVSDAQPALRYVLDCRQAPASVACAPAEATADCTLGVGGDTLVSMVEGRLHPQLAFMRGALKVQGDLAMAMRLGAVFA
jgi:cytidylate kinase